MCLKNDINDGGRLLLFVLPSVRTALVGTTLAGTTLVGTTLTDPISVHRIAVYIKGEAWECGVGY